MKRNRVWILGASLVVEIEGLARDASELLEVLLDDSARVWYGFDEVRPLALVTCFEVETRVKLPFLVVVNFAIDELGVKRNELLDLCAIIELDRLAEADIHLALRIGNGELVVFVTRTRTLVKHAVRVSPIHHFVKWLVDEKHHKGYHRNGAESAEERLVRVLAFVIYCYRYAKLVVPRQIFSCFLSSFPALAYTRTTHKMRFFFVF